MPRKIVRRKRPVYRKKLTKPMAKSVRTIVKRQLAQNIELKHLSNNPGIVGVSDIANINSVGLPVVGSGFNQRIGDSIKLKSFNFKYTIYLSDPSNVMRIIVFQWKNNSGISGTPTVQYILQQPTPYGWLSQHNQDTKQNYKILYDRTHTMQNGGPLQITRSVNINRFATTNIQFISDVATQNNCIKGEIYLLLISDSNVVIHPTFVWRSQMRYTDA